MGGSFEVHLAAHAFLDATKTAYAQLAHRFLLHSVDLGRQAALSDWLAELRPELLPRIASGPLAGLDPVRRADWLARRFDLPDTDLALKVCEFMALPSLLAPGAPPDALRTAMRNSFGIALAEACLGAVHRLPDGRRMGVRDLAEAEVMGDMKTIPPYAAVARAIRLVPWMNGGS